jgi:hypothetical protein
VKRSYSQTARRMLQTADEPVCRGRTGDIKTRSCFSLLYRPNWIMLSIAGNFGGLHDQYPIRGRRRRNDFQPEPAALGTGVKEAAVGGRGEPCGFAAAIALRWRRPQLHRANNSKLCFANLLHTGVVGLTDRMKLSPIPNLNRLTFVSVLVPLILSMIFCTARAG